MASKASTPKVAIVHDWLVGGGAEKVVLELHKMYPEAPIYTSYATKEWRDKLDNKVVTGYLGWWLFGKLRKFLALPRAIWFSSLDLRQFDLVLSSKGNGEASYVNVRQDAKHICYCHSPTHFYWRKKDEYLKNPGFGPLNWLARLGLRVLLAPLKSWDYKSMQNPDVIIANSRYIQTEILKSYQRESIVIHPPVDIARFSKYRSKTRSGFVTAGRQVPYKKMDLIVAACNQTKSNLVVLGSGPENAKLKALAGSTVTFVDNPSDKQMVEAMGSAKAFIFAANEDFGITPVEAMAAGTPVIAYKEGGALDYVVEGQTGEFFDSQSVESIVSSLKSFKSAKYQEKTIRKAASSYSKKEFSKKLALLISSDS